MKYQTGAAFRTALETRLLSQSQASNIPLVQLRKLVVFDRLMARLMAVAEGRWVLKGAVALHMRSGPQFRTTLILIWDAKTTRRRRRPTFGALRQPIWVTSLPLRSSAPKNWTAFRMGQRYATT